MSSPRSRGSSWSEIPIHANGVSGRRLGLPHTDLFKNVWIRPCAAAVVVVVLIWRFSVAGEPEEDDDSERTSEQTRQTQRKHASQLEGQLCGLQVQTFLLLSVTFWHWRTQVKYFSLVFNASVIRSFSLVFSSAPKTHDLPETEAGGKVSCVSTAHVCVCAWIWSELAFLQRKRDDSGSDHDAAAQPVKKEKKKKVKKEKQAEEMPSEPPEEEDTEVSYSSDHNCWSL